MAETRSILFTWLGHTDIRNAAKGEEGPIGFAVRKEVYSRVVVLAGLPPAGSDARNAITHEDARQFAGWFKTTLDAELVLSEVELTNAQDFTRIMRYAETAVRETRERSQEKLRVTFHMSPGTPAMGAVWAILANPQGLFPDAELIASSGRGLDDDEYILHRVQVPFRLSATRWGVDEQNLGKLDLITGESDAIKRVKERIEKFACSPAPVLIVGETGTGKELVADAIHSLSNRTGSFEAINCGAITGSLMGSELFGHDKGSFTGAERSRKGAFELANEGTLFLDELGELSAEAQVALLRAIQEEKVTPLGGESEIELDMRFISAMNRDPWQMVNKGDFREDLLYRLHVALIRVPTLRERKEDIPILVRQFISRLHKKGYSVERVTEKCMDRLKDHHWPGNVRELENALESAAAFSGGVEMDEEDLVLISRPAPEGEIQSEIRKHTRYCLQTEQPLKDLWYKCGNTILDELEKNCTKGADIARAFGYEASNDWTAKMTGIYKDIGRPKPQKRSQLEK